MKPPTLTKWSLRCDSRKRITLPKGCGIEPGDALAVERCENGSIILTPVLIVPKHRIEKGVLIENGNPCSILPS